MKKNSLCLLFVALHSLFFSVARAGDPPDYLKGAVPEVNGKVVFSRTFDIPFLTPPQMYDHLELWAEGRVKKNHDSIAYANRSEGIIILNGIDTLVFSKKFYFTDESSLSYILSVLCMENHLEINMENLYYEYIVSYMDKPETYYAEELITDKVALKSKGRKLKKKEGKFRRHTIDYFRSVCDEIEEKLRLTNPLAAIRHDAPSKDYLPLDEVPELLLSMLPESKMKLFPNENPENTMDVAWEGISTASGRKIIKFSYESHKKFPEEAYRLAFFRNGEAENSAPWLLIDCTEKNKTTQGNKTTVFVEISRGWLRK